MLVDLCTLHTPHMIQCVKVKEKTMYILQIFCMFYSLNKQIKNIKHLLSLIVENFLEDSLFYLSTSIGKLLHQH